MISPVSSRRRFEFDVPRERLWDTVGHTDQYTRWWPWLREFDVSGLVPGAVAECEVRAPLGYSVRFTVTLTEVVLGERVAGQVAGEIAGPATVTFAATGPATSSATLVSELSPQGRLVRTLTGVARPVATWSHDRILDVGSHQFRERALGD